MVKYSFIFCLIWLGCQQGVKQGKNGEFLSTSEITIDSNIIVLYFLNTECPVCQKYAGNLKPVYTKFKGACRFYYVFPGKQTKKDVKSFCEYDSIPAGNIIYDTDYENTKHFGAEITPQVMIFYKKQLVYSGKPDDRFESIASWKPKATINYIGNALISLQRNEPVEITKTDPVGCFIEPD